MATTQTFQIQVMEIIDMYNDRYTDKEKMELVALQESHAQLIFLYKDESTGAAGPTENEKAIVCELMALLDFAGLVTEEELKNGIVKNSQQEEFRRIEGFIDRACHGDKSVSTTEVLMSLETRLKEINKVMKLDMYCMPYMEDAVGGKPLGNNLTGGGASSKTKPFANDRPAFTLEDLAKGRFLHFVEAVQRGQEAKGYHPTVKSVTPWVWARLSDVVGPYLDDNTKHFIGGIDIPDESMDELFDMYKHLLNKSKIIRKLTATLDGMKLK